MCNAYGTIGYSRSAFIHDLLGIPRNTDYDRPARLVRPTDMVPVIRSVGTKYEQIDLRWGLVPAWAKTMPERPLTNARSESVEELRSFSESFRTRRCVMPAIEYYEWTKTTKKRRTFVPEQEEFLFAGLWDVWRDGDRAIESCVMLTTSANEVVAPILDRMPVIIGQADVKKWLDNTSSAVVLRALLQPLPAEMMALVPDSTEPPAQTSLF